jgi:hypothetical protein
MKGGKDLLGGIPFHEDATAGLMVTLGKNEWEALGWLYARVRRRMRGCWRRLNVVS